MIMVNILHDNKIIGTVAPIDNTYKNQDYFLDLVYDNWLLFIKQANELSLVNFIEWFNLTQTIKIKQK